MFSFVAVVVVVANEIINVQENNKKKTNNSNNKLFLHINNKILYRKRWCMVLLQNSREEIWKARTSIRIVNVFVWECICIFRSFSFFYFFFFIYFNCFLVNFILVWFYCCCSFCSCRSNWINNNMLYHLRSNTFGDVDVVVGNCVVVAICGYTHIYIKHSNGWIK